ncbi:MAG TPA: response regulator [Xanthomonadaceae bacterium]|nr:response regulator [Xanthomonadaceae bacterium]
MTEQPAHPESSALRVRADEWVRDLRACLDGNWDVSYVEDLHEAVDRLAMDADAAGDEDIESAALELSTYLCSFIGLVIAPTDAQRRTLLKLADALAPTATTASAVEEVIPEPVPAPEPEVARTPAPAQIEPETVVAAAQEEAPPEQVWCISSDPTVAEAMERALEGRGIELIIKEPSFSVAYAIPRTGVRCVVVDNAALGILPELQRETLVRQATDARRPTYVALLTDARTSERVRALRAGADHVLSHEGAAEALAARIGRILDTQTQGPLQVLVIDDDRSHTAFCSGILRRVGIDAVCCTDSASALEEMRRKLPDVVLVDLHMPGTDGFALTERLLEIPGTEFVSILFLSGDDEPETRFDALTAGGDDFLAKPIQPRHLIRAVAAHGRRAQRRRAAARLH